MLLTTDFTQTYLTVDGQEVTLKVESGICSVYRDDKCFMKLDINQLLEQLEQVSITDFIALGTIEVNCPGNATYTISSTTVHAHSNGFILVVDWRRKTVLNLIP